MEATRPGLRSPSPPFSNGALACPLCGDALYLDTIWLTPHWLCPQGHSYSNLRVLLAELQNASVYR